MSSAACHSQRRFGTDDLGCLGKAMEVGARLHGGLGIYHRRQDALAVLEEVRAARPSWFDQGCDEFVSEVAQLAPGPLPSNSFSLHPLVVVEGLDGVGKTTVTSQLADNMGATLFRTPSARFEAPSRTGGESVRERFRRQPETIARAFYCGTNYLAAAEVQAARRERPVLMDRWWGSTCSMALAGRAARMSTQQTSACDCLPEAGHAVYQWPSDLPAISMGVVLEVDEHIRMMRAKLRGDEKEEERQLAAREDMRKAAMLAYERMGLYTLVDVPKWPLAVNRIIDLLEERRVFPKGKLRRHTQTEIDRVSAF